MARHPRGPAGRAIITVAAVVVVAIAGLLMLL
jgi:hypothetical protein